MMLTMAQRPDVTVMLNHRGERIMPLPYRAKPKSQAKKTRKLSVTEDEYEQFHLTKKQRSDNNIEPELASSSVEEKLERHSPFDLHLECVYQGDADDGLQFFESHGYYDVTDANTVAMFRETFGLDAAFWLGKAKADKIVPEKIENPAVYPFGSHKAILSSRSLVHRERTASGRFMLLDGDGHPVDEHMVGEMAREDRLKAKSLALDDDEVAELAHDEVVSAHAVALIRAEKRQLQQLFLQSFHDEDEPLAAGSGTVPRSVETPVAGLDLPPYCGYVNVLKDTIPFLMRSWHKRWVYVDFQAGLVLMYKRSYWKSPRGVVDLRDVAHVEKMSQGDFRIEFRDTGTQAPAMMLLRSKLPEEAALWVHLLRFAKHASRGAPLVTDSLTDKTKAIMKKAHRKNQVDILAQLLTNSANSAGSSNLRAIAHASAVAASAVANRRQAKPHRHHVALMA